MVAMTDLLSRPILRVTSPVVQPDRPVVLVAAVGSAAVALGGLLVFVAVSVAGWFAASSGSMGDAIRVGALGWLVGNGSGLGGGGVSVHAVPLGFLLLFGCALYRIARWSGATSRMPSRWYVALAALTMGAVYGAIGTVTALVAPLDGVQAPLTRTAAAFVAVGTGFGGVGLLRGTGTGEVLTARLPEEARAALLGGFGGVLTLLGFSAAVLAGSLVVHFSTAVTLTEGARSGVVGSVILALVGAALVPNAVLCAGAFVAGPGFVLGTGTQVSPSGVRLGLLPDVPLLAALPTGADAWWLPALIVLPVVAGMAAGLLAVRRYPVYALDQAALRGALAGLAGGVAFGLLTVLATGSVGPGRLQHVGPDVLATTAVCVVAFVLGGAVAAASRRALTGVLGRSRSTAGSAPADFAPAEASKADKATEATDPSDASDPTDPSDSATGETTEPAPLG